MHYGIAVIIVLLVPTLFQVVIQSSKNRNRHEELLQRLDDLKGKLEQR